MPPVEQSQGRSARELFQPLLPQCLTSRFVSRPGPGGASEHSLTERKLGTKALLPVLFCLLTPALISLKGRGFSAGIFSVENDPIHFCQRRSENGVILAV